MKGRLFLACRKEVVRRKEDMDLFACKSQYLLARYFRCVHTTRKSWVSCAGQIAGKGVRVIEWHYHVIASWVRKGCLSKLIAHRTCLGRRPKVQESLGACFLLGSLDQLAFEDLTFFLWDRRDCFYSLESSYRFQDLLPPIRKNDSGGKKLETLNLIGKWKISEPGVRAPVTRVRLSPKMSTPLPWLTSFKCQWIISSNCCCNHVNKF